MEEARGKRVWCSLERGNSREIVKRKGFDVLWRDLVERSACENLWCDGHPSYPVYALWDGRGFLAGFTRASSCVRKVERGVRREECENSREFHGEEERGWCFFGEI